MSSLRDKRTGRTRKSRHKQVERMPRRIKKREDDSSIIRDVMNEWASDYEGTHDIFA